MGVLHVLLGCWRDHLNKHVHKKSVVSQPNKSCPFSTLSGSSGVLVSEVVTHLEETHDEKTISKMCLLPIITSCTKPSA